MAAREPLRETTGNSTVSATTRVSAGPAKRGEVRMEEQDLREWQRQWRRILARATVYFDCVDNQSISRVQPTLRNLGTTVDRFFSVKVTHVVTTRALDGKYPPGDVLHKAFAENMKVWTYEKLLRFLGYLLKKPTVQQMQQQDKLAVMLRQEKMLGPNDRDPTARREDYHYFKGPYILVWDPTSNYRPLMHKEYDKDGAPRLHLSSSSKCPFLEDERKRKRVDDHANAATATTQRHQPKVIKTTTVDPQKLIRTADKDIKPPTDLRLKESHVQPKSQTVPDTDIKRAAAADLRQREVNDASPIEDIKVSMTAADPKQIDEMKPAPVLKPTVTTSITDQSKSVTANAQIPLHRNAVKRATSVTELPERIKARPADSHTEQISQPQESTGPVRRGIWDKPTNNNDESHHHQSRFNEIAASGIKPSMTSAARSVVQSGTTDGGGNGLGAPTTQIASKEVNHLKKRVLSKPPPQKTQTTTSTTTKKQERGRSEEKKKQGWCENCQQRFDRLQDHIKSKKHILYANDSKNFVELDHLLHSLRRHEKQTDMTVPRTPETQLSSHDPQTPPTYPLSPTQSRMPSIYK